jgi:hypothetical protein
MFAVYYAKPAAIHNPIDSLSGFILETTCVPFMVKWQVFLNQNRLLD